MGLELLAALEQTYRVLCELLQVARSPSCGHGPEEPLPQLSWAWGRGGGVCSTGLVLMILSCFRRTSCLEGTGATYKPCLIKRSISACSLRGPGGEGCNFINKKLTRGGLNTTLDGGDRHRGATLT